MNLLTIKGFSKAYTDKILFDDSELNSLQSYASVLTVMFVRYAQNSSTAVCGVAHEVTKRKA